MTSIDKQKEKRAVVFIHGMGEQKPMSTLRDFVNAVLLPEEPHSPECVKFFSKPDRLSELLEVRKLSDARKGSNIDFYEYYWAHQSGDVSAIHVFFWLVTILLRPWRWSGRATLPFLGLWIFVISAIFMICYFARSLRAVIAGIWLQMSSWSIGLGDALGILSIIFTVVFFPVAYFLAKYLGDVEQYLRPKPRNIAFRQRVRQDGIQLLEHLHKENYDRIIIVGHSLGSVIGYDLIKHLWIKFNTEQREFQHFKDDQVSDLEKAAAKLKKEATPKVKKAFREAQEKLWDQQKSEVKLWNKQKNEAKRPWLISDFITIGSPLVHAKFLLAESKKDLSIRKADRELPTDPPVEEIFYRDPGFPVPHHAALFACICWTNMYFPGDFVAGPLSKAFGDGINDLEVRRDRISDYTIFSHTRYWKPSKRMQSCIKELQERLGIY
jgi:hypothetical protein